MLRITKNILIPDSEIELTAIRSQGAGGQNVNKVATAIHLRFDINLSSLPIEYKTRLLQTEDNRITSDGIIILKAQSYRTQGQNRADALQRLVHLIKKANIVPKQRKKTKPTKGSVTRRLEGKAQRSQVKKMRKFKLSKEDR